MNVDVAVVGTGPAACSAALRLLARGASVAVIGPEAAEQRPTETAAAVLPDLLKLVGAARAISECEPCFGVCARWTADAPLLRASISDPMGHTWFVNRTRFDAALLHCVQVAGAVRAEAKATSVTVDVNGAEITTANGLHIHARWLIAATGSPAWVARVTGQRATTFDSMTAFWSLIPAPSAERILHVEATDEGWWYVCPANDHEATACLVTDSGVGAHVNLADRRTWTARFQATRLTRPSTSLDPVRIQAAPIRVAELPRKFGPRWVAVGDCAVKFDPLGSSGLITAIDSGRRAADGVVSAIAGDESKLTAYARRSSTLAAEFRKQRCAQYAGVAPPLRSLPFWRARTVEQTRPAARR